MSAIVAVTALPLHAGVVAVAGSGYIQTQGQLENSDTGSTTPFGPTVNLVGFNGLGSFDSTASEQASLDGVTANVSARLQASASGVGGVTTISYTETFSGTQSHVTNVHGLVGTPISEVVFTVSTDSSTLVSWTFTDAYILSVLRYSGDGVLVGGDADGVDASGFSLSEVNGASAIRLAAGNHAFTLSDAKGFSTDGGFDITYGFDLMFSNAAVPGPIGTFAVLAIGLGRRRTR